MLLATDDRTSEVRGLTARVRERLASLREECPQPEPPSLREHVRDVVIIASSSRGGSSMLAEILRHAAGLLHFRGEINPFLLLNGLAYPLSGTGSDLLDGAYLDGHSSGDRALVAADRAIAATGRELSLDCGSPGDGLQDPVEVDRFALDLATRLTLQWPSTTFSWSTVRGWLVDALRRLRELDGWSPGVFLHPQCFHAVFLARVHEDEPTVNPYYYDLRPSLVRETCPGLPVPEGPPGPEVLEEPPFVTIGPWRRPRLEDLRGLPLIVKTPSNAYRLESIQRFFPAARIRVLHLTRSAAAAINGLYDGWLYRGFHSHRLREPLSIRGYSDAHPSWGKAWWKFDLPPGWQAQREGTLEEVCAFQWSSAHRSILEFLAAHPRVPRYRMRFESVVGTLEERLGAFRELFSWLGVPLSAGLLEMLHGGMAPIMATDQPRHRRWFRRAALLDRLLARPDILDLMDRLGYEQDPATWI